MCRPRSALDKNGSRRLTPVLKHRLLVGGLQQLDIVPLLQVGGAFHVKPVAEKPGKVVHPRAVDAELKLPPLAKPLRLERKLQPPLSYPSPSSSPCAGPARPSSGNIIPNKQTVLSSKTDNPTPATRARLRAFIFSSRDVFAPPTRVVGSTSKSIRTSRRDWSSLGALAGTACNCFIPAGK